jgi:hypothetical protein
MLATNSTASSRDLPAPAQVWVPAIHVSTNARACRWLGAVANPRHDGVEDHPGRARLRFQAHEAGVELAKETTQIDPGAVVSDPQGLTPSQARAGMVQMSAKFREMGGQVYVDAERVKKSKVAWQVVGPAPCDGPCPSIPLGPVAAAA